jgi:hypothetical protein
LDKVLNPLLIKILWFQRSKRHFGFAGLAFLFGLLLVLVALEVYFDFKQITNKRKSSNEFVIINKTVTLSNTLGLASSEFSASEIDTLKNQPFVKKIGYFEANQFQASIRTTQFINFFTLVFFEAVPDEFMDFKSPDWVWENDKDPVPIVLSVDFLNMYNFGFALSQGLPQVSKEAIKLLPVEIILQGEGGKRTFNAKIVGFSERIPSVLVPYSFMKWANEHIALKPVPQPSRLIVQVSGTDDPALNKYLQKKKYVTNQGQLTAGQTGTILNAVVTALGFLGLFFLILAFIIFSGNFRLIIAESLPEIKILIELGYKIKTLIWHLISFFLVFVVALFVFVIFLLYYSEKRISTLTADKGLELPQGINTEVWLIGGVFMIFMVLINIALIYRQFYKRIPV